MIREPMMDCPRFKGCNAPLCPLDPDWMGRWHQNHDRVCFFLKELGRPGGEERMKGALPEKISSQIVQIAPAILRHSRTRTQLEAARRLNP